MKFGDLVSIVVVSYNSSETIMDTLNSIYYQDYECLELIITDDCSTDNTIELVNKWCERHNDRFIDIHVNLQKYNVGTANNIEAGMRLATGDWTKPIAADDILLKDCISNNMKFIVKNGCNSIVCSRMITFKIVDRKEQIILEGKEEVNFLEKLSLIEPKKQYELLLKRDTLSTPTIFINMQMYDDIGGFDTRIKYIEDWPFKLKLTNLGYKIYFLDKQTVKYRIGNSSSHRNAQLYSSRHLKQIKQLKKMLCYPNIPKWHIVYYYEEILINIKDYVMIRILKNKNNILTRTINNAILLLVPRKWSKIIWKIKNLLLL